GRFPPVVLDAFGASALAWISGRERAIRTRSGGRSASAARVGDRAVQPLRAVEAASLAASSTGRSFPRGQHSSII
ncbi:MAG: hypothetical protein DI607_14850, partial [Sphingomonas hengshuiensis]